MTESHRNNIYKAFREVGRVLRTITLLRFISEPKLREEITAATNKASSVSTSGFCQVPARGPDPTRTSGGWPSPVIPIQNGVRSSEDASPIRSPSCTSGVS
ncbi:MAG: transposase [Actinomycetota bacterium]|nr:transposase [Actinomycetota bacterium]